MSTYAKDAAEIAGTPRQVAAMLRCSTATVYRAIHRGELEAVRLGERGSLRIREDALDRFVRPTRSRGNRPGKSGPRR